MFDKRQMGREPRETHCARGEWRVVSRGLKQRGVSGQLSAVGERGEGDGCARLGAVQHGGGDAAASARGRPAGAVRGAGGCRGCRLVRERQTYDLAKRILGDRQTDLPLNEPRFPFAAQVRVRAAPARPGSRCARWRR